MHPTAWQKGYIGPPEQGGILRENACERADTHATPYTSLSPIRIRQADAIGVLGRSGITSYSERRASMMSGPCFQVIYVERGVECVS